MMYFSAWMVLVVLSLWVAMGAFLWALKSGQFSDQGRARFLALNDDLPLAPAKSIPKRRIEAYALLAVLIIGFVTMLAAIVLSLFRLKG